ncbi:MAG TPA: NB-ARC domain-containing protein [Candidatus Obscuribacterales bacterium]
MDVTEVLQFADHLVFDKTEKHLDDLQKTVIKGVYEGKTYETIAEECHRSESRVRSVGRKLWKMFSEELGENIKKSNFVSTIERLQVTSSPSAQIVGINHNFHFCTQTFNQSRNYRESDINTNTQSKSDYHDLTLAPKIIKFYNRETELQTLSSWIFNQNIRLISVLGLSGIGKTYLVRRFINLNLEQFEVIIWKSLKFPKSLDLLINDLFKVCQQEAKETLDDKLKQLFDIFTQKRCLIILDDVQNIFISGQFAGQYQTEYKDYQKFFTMITETEHQSNIILISQEKCAEMHCLDQQLYPIKYLELSGLDDIKILDNTGLNNQDSWLKLIRLYEGNPTYLKNIVSLIQDVYDGEVADFSEENSLIITQNMQSHFNDLFNRLSPIEQQIILELSKLEAPMSREDLKQKLPLSSVDFVKGLQSLQQRYLVTKIKEDKILFKLSPVFREYVINYCKD